MGKKKKRTERSEAEQPDAGRATRRPGEPAPSPHSHDGLFKRTFGVKENALDLIRHQLPEKFVAALDPGSLKEEPGHYLDDAVAETRSDVLYSATLRGAPVLVYVLIEHQSTQDPLMAYRLLRYVVRIWERWLRSATADADGVPPRTLPPVVPFVLHQGPRPWSVARSLGELIPLPAELAPLVRPFLPGLDVSVLDLGADEPAALAAWKTAPIVRFTLAAMRSVVDPGVDLFAVMTVFHRDLPAILGRPDGREAFAVVMRYIVRKSSDLDVAELASHLAKLAGPEAGEVVMSTAQELIDQGKKQGLEQGLEQGEAKGVREILTRQLVAKFGRLDAATTRRLADATLSDLARWSEQILSAKRVDDVFARAKASRRGKRPRGR